MRIGGTRSVKVVLGSGLECRIVRSTASHLDILSSRSKRGATLILPGLTLVARQNERGVGYTCNSGQRGSVNCTGGTAHRTSLDVSGAERFSRG